MTTTDLIKIEKKDVAIRTGFDTVQGFESLQRVAKVFSISDLVPKEFKGNLGNCVIAVEMSNRMGVNPMAVMQNLYVVHGKPSWSATFIIAGINQCGRFSPLRYEMKGDGDARSCVAWAYDLETKEKLESPEVSIVMAKKEGWFQKTGSKWQTMPDLMLRYRAATFFGRLYAPDLLMGIRTAEENEDIYSGEYKDVVIPTVEDILLSESEEKNINDVKSVEEILAESEPQVPDKDPVKQPKQTQKTKKIMVADNTIACPLEDGKAISIIACESCPKSADCPEYS